MFNPINYHPSLEVANQKIGFWRRQFLPSRTNGQLIFDVSFGVVAPIVCFIFDPIVFQSGSLPGPLLPSYQTFVYMFSGFQILLLCFWILRGAGPRFTNVLMGGALFSGGIVCVVLGFLLAPFSLLGLMLLVGALGFTPLITAMVYFRNGWRALSAQSNKPYLTPVSGFVCGLLLSLSVPAAVSIRVRAVASRSVDEILNTQADKDASRAAQRLALLKFVDRADVDRIVNAYAAESTARRKEILKTYYRQITGEDIEERIRSMD